VQCSYQLLKARDPVGYEEVHVERTQENIDSILATMPVSEAIKALNEQRKGCLLAIEDLEAKLAKERSWLARYNVLVPKLESVQMLTMSTFTPAPEPSAANDADAPDDADAQDEGATETVGGMSREDMLLAEIERSEPTLAELTDAVKLQGLDITWHSVYHIVDYGAQSFTKQGRVIFDKSSKPGRVRINPDWKPPACDYDDFIRRIYKLDEERKHEPRLEAKHKPVVALFAEGMKLHTDALRKKHKGKRVHAQRTWDRVGDQGLIGAIQSIVLGPETTGYATLIEAGRPDLLPEKIVIDHPHLFLDEAVAAAKRRWAKLFPEAA
jgi:hypothetical protein